MGALEEGEGLLVVEFDVFGFDGEEEFVIGDATEAGGVEEGVIELGETAETPDAEEAGDGGEEDGEFKDDGDVGGEGPVGFAGDDEGVAGDDVGAGGLEVRGVDVPLQEDADGHAGEASAEYEEGEDGFFYTHSGIEAVDGEGGETIPAGVAGVTDFFSGVEDFATGAVLGEEAVETGCVCPRGGVGGGCGHRLTPQGGKGFSAGKRLDLRDAIVGGHDDDGGWLRGVRL